MLIAGVFPELALTAPAGGAWITSQWQSLTANAGSALVTAIWQGAVIVCALEIALRLMPRISAAHRFALWFAGFALALAAPFLQLIHFGSGAIAAPSAASQIANPATHAVLQVDERWGLAIAALWILAAVFRAADLAVHSIRLRRLWKAAQPVEISESLFTVLSGVRAGRAAICTTRMLDRPSVIGFVSPRILIPEWLLSRLTPGELEQIVLHEAEHLRRRDDWTNLFQKLCLVLFPLNPALAWIERRLCREREMACDEGVIRITNAPRAYAACLAGIAERGLERRAEALSLGAWHRRSELVHRVHRILLGRRMMSKTAGGAVLAVLGSTLFAGSLEMARCPKLVAFVAKHNTQAMTAARQAQLGAILDRADAETKVALPPNYRAVQARAVLPQTHPVVHTRKHEGAKQAAERAVQPTEQIAQTDVAGDRVMPADSHLQQWIVVAAWEEVSTVSRAPQNISDFGPAGTPARNSAVSPSMDSTAQPAGTQNEKQTPTRRFTVTQLILRVMHANPKSNSTPPATVSVREGWFVIQL